MVVGQERKQRKVATAMIWERDDGGFNQGMENGQI